MTAHDHWLDRVDDRRSVYYPIIWARKLFAFLVTTPGKMTSLVVILSVFLLAAGLALAQFSTDRRGDLETMLNSTEPVNYLTHRMYSSLSVANTLASVVFVRAGSDATENKERYHAAISDASTALTQAAAGLEQEELETLNTISSRLPVYNALVETAWLNARQGNPVGASYMSEANVVMRDEILPAAAKLHNTTDSTFLEQQRAFGQPLQWPILGMVFALAALIAGQVWLAKVTRRRLNPGMVVATAMVVAVLAWVGTASALTWRAASTAREVAAAPMSALVDARIVAQQTRSTETLALVLRQSLDASNASFATAIKTVNEALDTYASSPLAAQHQATLDIARSSTSEWEATHRQLSTALNSGDYDEALNITLSTTKKSAFMRLNDALGELINSTRDTMRSYSFRSLEAFSVVGHVVLILTISAVLSIWIGIRPRLQEFL